MEKYFYLALLLGTIGMIPVQAAPNGELRERVYLQTDKQMYLAGEQVWIKVLTTTPESIPLDFSKVAYVELVDAAGSPVQMKLDVAHGVGTGCMVLPTNIPTGFYRLVAYTRYMRNEDRAVFFEKNIGIVNLADAENTGNTKVTNAPYTAKNQATAEAKDNTLSLTTDKAVYVQRSPVQINMGNLPEDVHTLSVSVTGRDYTSAFPQGNITRWVTDLQQTPATALSNKYLPEYEGHIITGKLIDETTGQPTGNNGVAPFVAFSGDNIRMFGGQIHENGILTFFTKGIAGGKELIAALKNPTDQKFRVDIESPFVAGASKKPLPLFNLNAIDNNRLLQQSVALQVLYSYMNDSLNRFEIATPYFHTQPDKSYLLDEYTRFATMGEVITEFITSVRFDLVNGKRSLAVWKKYKNWSSGNTLALLDGIPIFDHDILYKYNPSLLNRIDVYFDRYVFGGQSFDGIISFTTAKNNYPELEPDNSIRFFPYDGTQEQRLFFAPVYEDNETRENRLPDYRQTLYWNPDVLTNGKTTLTIPVYTSDVKGEYQITVEGLTKDGQTIHATSILKVE